MRPIVQRINTPAVARAVVRHLADAVHDGVAQVEVGRGHVDLRAQRACAVRKLASAHAGKQIEVLLDRAVAVRAFVPRLGERAATFADLVGRQVVHVGFAILDEPHGPRVELLEVIGGEVQVRAPVEAKPAHVVHDGLDVLGFLFGRVGVIKTQVAAAAVLGGDAEVQADGLGVADVQIAVWLRWKARDDAPAPFIRRHILGDDGADEVGGFRCRNHVHRI